MRALRDTVADAFGGNKFRARPDRLSFTRSLRAARRTTASHPGFSPDALDDAGRCVTAEILHELLPTRRARANPRVVKRKMSVYQVKHRHHRCAPIIEHRPVITCS